MKTQNQRIRATMRGGTSLLAAVLGSVLFSSACGGGDGGSKDSLPQETPQAVETYSEIVYATYQDTLEEAKHMEDTIAVFIDDPSEQTLSDARQAWLDSREPYLQSEAFRFYEGPIDEVEGMMNAWPLDEGYIDYVEDDTEAGIINDPDVEISEDTLMDLNEQGGEENIATGYHAIEFLLWGQDGNDDGPGDRSYTDYVEDGEMGNYERRALYLQTVCDLLVSQLETLVEAWKPGKDNYRAEFEALEPREALKRILTGMIVLSGFETGGERLKAALDSGSEEDEHSCFSDNTHRDMIQDVQGVLNVWQGSYERVDGSKVSGTSLGEVIRAVDSELADEIEDRIDESLALANALHVPFDHEIASDNDAGNERVRKLVDSLRAQEQSLEKTFEALGLDVSVGE